MRKRITAWLILTVMIVNLIPSELFANPQKPIPMDGIKDIVVQNRAVSTLPGADIMPKVSVQWDPAPNNDPSSPPNPDRDRNVETYRFELTDSTALNARIYGERKAYTGTLQDNIEDRVKDVRFTNGRLYKLRILPAHTEVIGTGDNQQQVLVEPITNVNQPEAYFLTDFNTKAKDVDGKLQVTWEYIPGGQYEVIYVPADRKTVEEIENSADSSGNKIASSVARVSSDYAKLAENQLIEDGARKVKYTLTDADPGQVYSVYVKLVGLTAENPFGIRFDQVRQNTKKDSQGPKVAQATTSINLKVFNVGANDVRLEWTLASWLRLNPRLISETRIKQRVEGGTSEVTIGTIPNQDSVVEYYQYTRPTRNTYFLIEFIIEGQKDPLRTKEVLYIPSEAVERPLQPQVPKPFSESLDLSKINISEYKVVGDDMNTNDPRLIQNTFHAKKSPQQIQLIWNAPKIFNAQNQLTTDYNQYYDIFVTEDRKQLDELGLVPIVSNGFLNQNQTNKLIFKQDNKTVVGFKWLLDQYTTKNYQTSALMPNKTYYIKIVAKREYGNDYINSEPTVVTITIGEDGNIFVPPVLAKPPLKLHKTTTETATLRWLTTWYELSVKDQSLRNAYDALQEGELAKNWNSVVYTGSSTSPYIRFKKADPSYQEHILKTSNDLLRVQGAVNGATTYGALYIDREVTLGNDSKYEIKVLGYDEVNRQIDLYNQTAPKPISIEEWIVEKESDTTSGWESINPKAPQTDLEEDRLPWLEYTQEGLRPNTRYVILVRAYRVLADGTKLQQTFPSYVICTTLTDYESPEETPKTPELNLDTKNDVSATVWWTYSSSFDYEIVYGRLDDVSKATKWDFTISDVPGNNNYVSNGAKASVKITGLIPETSYNIWIRAKQKKGTLSSAWSNPVTVKTDILGIPAAPTGLGPAAYQSILELGKDFPAVTKDYITVEWIKNANDVTETSSDAEKQYSYIVEFADNPEFLDAVIVKTSEIAAPGGKAEADQYEVLAKNIVKFNNLISNRPYYVKVKTVLTFKDREGNREIIKESDYTQWVRIITLKSSDEYDGGANENIVIYPDAIIENYSKDIWTIEIVDTAKVISDIMKNKAYFYTVKAEKFNNKQDATIRRIKMPKTVVDALINQRMEIRVVTNIGVYEIPAKALAVYTNKYSAKDMIQLDFTKIVDYKIANILRPYPEAFIKGEQLDIVIKGKTNTTIIKKLDGFLRAKIKLDAAKEYLYKDLFAYTYNFDRNAWIKENYSIDTLIDTYVSYLTPATGIYAVYQKTKGSSSTASSFAMNTLTNTYGISGLGSSYRRFDPVSRNQYVHLLLGIAQNKSEINLASAMHADILSKAKAAGLYTDTNAGVISEEQALLGVVKLYELKNGFKIKPSSIKFANVGAKYQEAAAKAYAIGLIEDINPKQPVTYEVLCDWILQVTE